MLKVADFMQVNSVDLNQKVLLPGSHMKAARFHGFNVVRPLVDDGYVMARLGEQSRDYAASASAAQNRNLLANDVPPS